MRRMLFSVLILGLALQTKFEAVLSEEPDAAGSHHSNSLLKADEEQAAGTHCEEWLQEIGREGG